MPRGQGGTLSGFTPLSTPNAPTGLSVDAGIGSATVSFTAPSETGDAAITSYIVTAVDESTGASTGATGTSSPINLPLSGGTFKIRAQAVNAFGAGRLTEYDTGNQIYAGAELYAWGRGNDGRLGDGTVVSKSSPIQVGALTDWAQVSSVGANGVGAIKTDGTLWTWGNNTSGRLGLGDVVSRSSPTQVGALTTWSKISLGLGGGAAIKTTGTLWAWGSRTGDGTTIFRSSPVQIGSLTNWVSVSFGEAHANAIKTDNTLWTWGQDNFGQLGQNTLNADTSSPVQVGALSDWVQATASSYFSIAVRANGTLWAWGKNLQGNLGTNNLVYRSSPTQVGALTNWSKITNGRSDHVAAIKTDGTLWAWGLNFGGAVGDSTDIRRSSPVQIGSLTDWAQVETASSAHTAAIKTDGTLWVWGLSSNGQLGLGTGYGTNKSSPVQLGALSNWAKIALPYNATLALLGV